MSTDPSTTEQIAAAVLAEHEWLGPYYGCRCLTATPDESECRDIGWHRAHVAQQIAARLDDGLRAKVRKLAGCLQAEADGVEQDGTPEQEVEQFILNSVAGQLRTLLDQTRTEADR